MIDELQITDVNTYEKLHFNITQYHTKISNCFPAVTPSIGIYCRQENMRIVCHFETWNPLIIFINFLWSEKMTNRFDKKTSENLSSFLWSLVLCTFISNHLRCMKVNYTSLYAHCRNIFIVSALGWHRDGQKYLFPMWNNLGEIKTTLSSKCISSRMMIFFLKPSSETLVLSQQGARWNLLCFNTCTWYM